MTIEHQRLEEDRRREKNWKRWGPYLSERQWGTVREDYSADGACWDYFSHEDSRSRTYRWGEDGLLGICDRKARLCFAFALWNGKDPILKERLYGFTGPQGNHGEDVKEMYYYLDSLPTHSYLKALYKYPQNEFPYQKLQEENRNRKRTHDEYELIDTGIFDSNEYFDVFAEYAKNSPEDILIKLTVHNRSTEPREIHLLPTLWFRNTWIWGRTGEGYTSEPRIFKHGDNLLCAEHQTLGTYFLAVDPESNKSHQLLFTNNETNFEKLYGEDISGRFVKDAFHSYVIHKKQDVVNTNGQTGTKACSYSTHTVPAGQSTTIKLRLFAESATPAELFGNPFEEVFTARTRETDEFYSKVTHAQNDEQTEIQRQAYAGLLWSKQFYYYSISEWLEGDPAQPKPAPGRARVRNTEWKHLYNRDVISMPDKWEYPWYAAWDLAFHMLPFAKIDPDFAKQQLLLMLREWYMHPNGQIPAYEFSFSDVNPPVHAWACWRVYKMSAPRGERDRGFLERAFHKLLLNFTWWVNRKDLDGKNLFAGGFLGLDNIGVFDRGQSLDVGGRLEQADATAWMAFYCGTMLSIALELAREDEVYEGVASKFFEHFIAIIDAMNSFGGSGLWDKKENFYYDQLHFDAEPMRSMPLAIRSLVGLIPLAAVEVLEDDVINALPAFRKRVMWFLENKPEVVRYISYSGTESDVNHKHSLLAVPSRGRLERLLKYMLDENEFLSPYGIRSLSKYHHDNPFVLRLHEKEYCIGYEPGESNTEMFGGNSNWRGPIWFPINFLLIEALERYHHFYGDTFQIEFPTGSGKKLNLKEVSVELSKRLVALFEASNDGARAYYASEKKFKDDPHWNKYHLFYEHFHGDSGRGLGASHQTGWTALVALCIEKLVR